MAAGLLTRRGFVQFSTSVHAHLNQLLRSCNFSNSHSFTTTPANNEREKTGHSSSQVSDTATHPITVDSRWLSTVKQRLKKCITFGLTSQQVSQAGDILRTIASEWRDLTAGSEGFLTGETRRGLFRHSVVWGEMDVMGHVNNVAYVRYAETARVNWTRNLAVHIDPAHRKEWIELIGSTGIGLILRSIKIDYKFPMTSPDKITVYHKLSEAPPSPASPDSGSYSAYYLDVLILSEAHQRPAARCYEDIVIYDYRQGQKTTLPRFMIDQFRDMWELQEKAKRDSSLRIQEIESKVRELELNSWDREDAVEDTGSAP